jgi:TctA family transporter
VFLTRPISAGFIIASVLLLLLLPLPALRKKRAEVFHDESAEREAQPAGGTSLASP